MTAKTLDKLVRIKRYYPDDNHFGGVISKLLDDIRNDASADTIRQDCDAAQQELRDPTCSLHNLLDEVKLHFG